MESLRWTRERGGKGIGNGVLSGEWRDHGVAVEWSCRLAQELNCDICHGRMEIGWVVILWLRVTGGQ